MRSKTIQMLEYLGRVTISLVNSIGRFGMFLFRIPTACSPPLYIRQLLNQVVFIGYNSLTVVGLTAFFTGAVLALQSYTGFSKFNAENTISNIVVLSMTRELGPVLCGLMLAGRVGAKIAAEIGTMNVTEQLYALYTLNTNPYRYLIVPRVLAAVIVTPILVLIADVIGVMGGYIVCVYKFNFSEYNYLYNTINFLVMSDVISGLIKAAFFGFIVSCMGCYFGFSSRGGAEGVGISTTNAVVASSVMILLANYVITGVMFSGGR